MSVLKCSDLGSLVYLITAEKDQRVFEAGQIHNIRCTFLVGQLTLKQFTYVQGEFSIAQCIFASIEWISNRKAPAQLEYMA